MTLIVYKDGMLAADRRSTHRCTTHRNNNCAHCGKEATSVNDETPKISVITRRKSEFRGDKILAMASAGEKKLLTRVQSMIRSGYDIEQVYQHYQLLHGSEANPDTCSTVLICEKMNYVIRVPKHGDLVVIEKEKDKFIFLGSGTPSADWINKLLPHLTAPQIVNLAMHEDLSVGGDIDMINFNREDWVTTWTTEKYVKIDPQSMLDSMVQVFQRGKEAMIGDQKKTTTRRKPPARAPQ